MNDRKTRLVPRGTYKNYSPAMRKVRTAAQGDDCECNLDRSNLGVVADGGGSQGRPGVSKMLVVKILIVVQTNGVKIYTFTGRPRNE